MPPWLSLWALWGGWQYTGPDCTGHVKCWFFPIWLSFEKPLLKNNHQCFIPFWGIKVTFFQSAKPCHKVKKTVPTWPSLGWLHAPVRLCGGWARTSRIHRVLSLWAGASNPWLQGTWNGKKDLGFKLAIYGMPLLQLFWAFIWQMYKQPSESSILSTLNGLAIKTFWGKKYYK